MPQARLEQAARNPGSAPGRRAVPSCGHLAEGELDFWTQKQIEDFIGIEKAFVEFCEADPKLSDLDSIHPGSKSEKFKEWYIQYRLAHDAATERFVKLFREKILDAWALRDDKEDDDGVRLPPEYWAPSVASLTFTTGKVEGLLLDERHKHLANSRAVLRREEWEKWINPAEPSDKQEKPRKYDSEVETKRKIRIEAVLAKARTRWSEKRSPIDVMAHELERLDRDPKRPPKERHGYKFEAIRKILRGTYGPQERLGIPGL